MPKINKSMTPSCDQVAQSNPIAQKHARGILRFPNVALRLSSLCLISLLGLSACSTDPSGHKAVLSPGVLKEQQAAQRTDEGEQPKPDVVVEANPDQLSIPSDTELESDPSLPKQDLDAVSYTHLTLPTKA